MHIFVDRGDIHEPGPVGTVTSCWKGASEKPGRRICWQDEGERGEALIIILNDLSSSRKKIQF